MHLPPPFMYKEKMMSLSEPSVPVKLCCKCKHYMASTFISKCMHPKSARINLVHGGTDYLSCEVMRSTGDCKESGQLYETKHG